jgi:hypothetical protein
MPSSAGGQVTPQCLWVTCGVRVGLLCPGWCDGGRAMQVFADSP